MGLHIRWYKTVLLQGGCSFNGRADRIEFWTFAFTSIFIFIFPFLLGFAMIGGLTWNLVKVLVLLTLSILLPWVAVSVRRLHDIGKSGWWCLLIFFPIVDVRLFFGFSLLSLGFFYFLYLTLKKSEPGANKYGEPTLSFLYSLYLTLKASKPSANKYGELMSPEKCHWIFKGFRGRAGRREFWTFILLNVMISSVLAALGKIRNFMLASEGIFMMLVFVPMLAVCVRRLHDTDKSGWWCLLLFLPVINIILFSDSKMPYSEVEGLLFCVLGTFFALAFLVYLTSRASQQGTNEYGEPAPTKPHMEA